MAGEEPTFIELPLSNRQVGILIRRGIKCVGTRQKGKKIIFQFALSGLWRHVDIKTPHGYTRIVQRGEDVVGLTQYSKKRGWYFKIYER